MFAILIGFLVILIYLLNQRYFSYWSRHGFAQLNPTFIIGNAGELLTAKCSMGKFLKDIYNKHKEHKAFGLYMFYRPVMIINDAKLVQNILIRDFTSFHDRPMSVDETGTRDPMSTHLFNQTGQKWRDLRVKLSPTFTSGKLKGMYPIIKSCGDVLGAFIEKNVKQGVEIFDIRDLMARFSTNIISSVAFGIDNDCINEPDHIFRRMGAKFFANNFKNSVRAFFLFFGNKMFHKLRMKTVDDDVEDFIFSIVKQTIEHREKENLTRNDFMQLLIQLKNQGYVSADKGDKEQHEQAPESRVNKLNVVEMAANVFVFFIAGELQRLNSFVINLN